MRLATRRWEQHAGAARGRRAEYKKGGETVQKRLMVIENEMKEIVRQREQLARNDPRALLQAERARNETLEAKLADARAEAETAVKRLEAETAKKLEVQQALQARDEEIAQRKLEFGEPRC